MLSSASACLFVYESSYVCKFDFLILGWFKSVKMFQTLFWTPWGGVHIQIKLEVCKLTGVRV